MSEYPPFREGPRRLCRRLIRGGSKTIEVSGEKPFRLHASARTSAASLRPGDWVGLLLNARREVTEALRLAPGPGEFRPPAIARETLLEWNLFLKTVRGFFEKKGFLEAQTPTLTVCPGTEPFLDVFETTFRQGRREEKFFLPTSPELHLKKMIARGYGPLFEMRPCFRNGEISDHHQPEFWMLEWYRPGQDLEAIRRDCHDLVRACAKALKRPAPKSEKRFTMRELFRRELDFELTPRTPARDLRAKSEELGLRMPEGSDFDEAFYFLFLEKIEPRIPQEPLVFVGDYPPSQAALARLTADGWGDRFEMYWKGMELANAYHELNDPVVQRQRSQEDLRRREARGAQTLRLDEDFLRALEEGMPPTAGIALGLERLFMALTNKKSLTEVRLFPIAP